MPTNPLLQEERDKATFSIEQMINFLDGSAERTRRRREIEGWILNDSAWKHEPIEFCDREQQHAIQLHKGAMAVRLMQEKEIEDPYEKFYVKRMTTGRWGSSLDLHTIMFIPSIMGQGTNEQIDRWLGPAMGYEILGTYAQTEMGHGTFLRGIETTATYDPSTEEFVLHTPTITATKWWPGSLGKTVNHAVVMAQLYTRGECYGGHLFFMRLRDQETHKPLPGIILGDIGPKFGYGPIDNGFMRLQHVRIPRDQMLMRHSEVTADGRYVKRRKTEGGEKLSYGTMVFVRAVLVGDVARGLSEAVTIATRYSAIRLQGERTDGQEGEVKVLDYLTQQYKLLPLIARAYSLFFCGEKVRNDYFEVAAEIGEGNLERMPELHALSSCLKAYGTDAASDGIEKCRKACGGHGYSLASGIPQIYMSVTPACTYEGENTVLYLQTARYLLKCYQTVQRSPSNDLPPSVKYLSHDAAVEMKPKTVTDLDWITAVHFARARRMLWQVGADFNRVTTSSGEEWHSTFNRLSIRFVRLAQAHAQAYLISNMVSDVRSARGSIRQILLRLAVLSGLHTITEESGDFLKTETITVQTLAQCQRELESTLIALRPEMVALVDSFDLPDTVLNSVLGRYDGDVYDNLFEWAQRAPFNKKEVHSSFFKTSQPLGRGEALRPLSKL